MNRSELKHGQVLSCEGCGFELRVKMSAQMKNALDACCVVNITCWGEPMKIINKVSWQITKGNQKRIQSSSGKILYFSQDKTS